MDAEGQFSIIKAHIPLAEMHQFGSDLRSLTQGRARFATQFDHYEAVPFDLQKVIVSENKQHEELV